MRLIRSVVMAAVCVAGRLRELGPPAVGALGVLLMGGSLVATSLSCTTGQVRGTSEAGAGAADVFGIPLVGPYLRSLADRMARIEAEGGPKDLSFGDIAREALLALGGGLTAGAGVAHRRDRSRATLLAGVLTATKRAGPEGIDPELLGQLQELGIPAATLRRASAALKRPRAVRRAS